jgi:Ras-related protein Rab-32
MSRIYYKDAIAAMIVFDVSSQDTFEAVEKWKQDVNEKVFLPDGNPVPCILVANKVDLRNDVNMNQIAEYAEKNGYIGVVETSALTNLNVASAFQMVTDHVMKDSKHVLKKEIDEDYGLPLSMEKTSTPPQSESYCCGGMTSRY